MIIPVEEIQVDLDEVYNLKTGTCTAKTCKSRRTNCRQNPFCLQNLGEKKWLSLAAGESSAKLEDVLKAEERQAGELPGLTNLGATCYVNSLLQLWFHNPAFRNAVYRWNPFEDPVEEGQGTIGTLDYRPVSPLGHLQRVFAFLQFSKRKIVDTTMFVESLGLDSMIQQDAQEFSKLFITLLENKFSGQTDPGVNSLVRRKLRGTYEYVTTCLGCQSESSSQTPFYELNLNLGTVGRRTLENSLAEFLGEEYMGGDNQYFCSVCNSHQNATRRIRLLQLSPVLSFQLLRFVYDRKAGHKKKVHTPFQFTDTIDMTGMVHNSSELLVYDLRAVLIHQGNSAFSGHYIAHIYDESSGQWFKFNDEVVEKIEGRKLKLGNEESDGQDSKKKNGEKSVKLPKGTYSSTNAYMLVYTRRGETSKEENVISSLEALPDWLRQMVVKDNEELRNSICERVKEQTHKDQQLREVQQEILKIYESLPTTANEDWEMISTSWLKKWLNQDPSRQVFQTPIDNSSLLCIHDCVYVEAVKDFKCVRKPLADFLFNKYSGGPRLNRESLCETCAVGYLARKKIKSAIADDAKRLTTMLKVTVEPSIDSFWVGKESLKCWRRLVTKDVEDDFPVGLKMQRSETPVSQEDSASGDEVKVLRHVAAKPDVVPLDDIPGDDSDGAKEKDGSFNDEIICGHGNLSWMGERRRLVSSEAWNVLRRYFPEVKEYRGDISPCPLCKDTVSKEIDLKNTMKLIAKEQKDALTDLFRGRARPVPCQFSGDLYLVSDHFLSQWRSFLRDPGRNENPVSVGNETLLCRHRGLLYFPDAIDFGDSKAPIKVLRPEEWSVLTQYVSPDVVVTLKCPELLPTPGVCDECLSARTMEELQKMLQYESARIFVRLEEDKQTVSADEEEEASAKKRRKEESEEGTYQAPIVIEESRGRRSQRHRKTRGEKEFRVSSTDTLKDLKVLVMSKFGVATFDQRLFLHGKELTDPTATLGYLEIVPGSVLTLKVDEVPEDVDLTDVIAGQHPEEGFKGTILLN